MKTLTKKYLNNYNQLKKLTLLSLFPSKLEGKLKLNSSLQKRTSFYIPVSNLDSTLTLSSGFTNAEGVDHLSQAQNRCILFFTHTNCSPNSERCLYPELHTSCTNRSQQAWPSPPNLTNPTPNSNINLQNFVCSVIWTQVQPYQPVNMSRLVRYIPYENFLIGHSVLLHCREQGLVWKSGLKLSSVSFILVVIEADWQFLWCFRGANAINASKTIMAMQMQWPNSNVKISKDTTSKHRLKCIIWVTSSGIHTKKNLNQQNCLFLHRRHSCLLPNDQFMFMALGTGKK